MENRRLAGSNRVSTNEVNSCALQGEILKSGGKRTRVVPDRINFGPFSCKVDSLLSFVPASDSPEHHVRWNKGANTFRPRWEELSLDSWLFGQGGRQTLTANPTPVGTSTSMSRMFIWDIPKWGTGSLPTPRSIRARAPASTPSTVL